MQGLEKDVHSPTPCPTYQRIALSTVLLGLSRWTKLLPGAASGAGDVSESGIAMSGPGRAPPGSRAAETVKMLLKSSIATSDPLSGFVGPFGSDVPSACTAASCTH